MPSRRALPRRALRPVKMEMAAPTRTSVRAERTMAATRGAVPEPKKKGTRGTRAPRAKEPKDEPAATQGEARSEADSPSSSLARVSRAVSGRLMIRAASDRASSVGMPLAS
jgi:hypothetical protein